MSYKKSFTGFKFLKNLNLKLIGSEIEEEVPIFFNNKLEKFCFFLNDDFLKNIKKEEIYNFDRKYENFIIKENESEFIYFTFNSIAELKKEINEETSRYGEFKSKYNEYLLDITSGEKVIVIAFSTDNIKYNEEKTFTNNIIQNNVINELIEKTYMKYEVFKAIRFNNKYYFLDENEQLIQNKNFKLNKNNSEADTNFLVLKYTEDDWIMAVEINKRILKLKENLSKMFNNSKTLLDIDNDLESVSLIENKKSLKLK